MSIILKFKKFQEETKKALSKILEEYFSKESEIFNDITDMTRDWEDDGVEFKYDIYINLSRENPKSGGHSQDMDELDLEKFISSFYFFFSFIPLAILIVFIQFFIIF